MIVISCRNRIADIPKWKAVFDSHAQVHRAAGLRSARRQRPSKREKNHQGQPG
jgi:hypothetical protein